MRVTYEVSGDHAIKILTSHYAMDGAVVEVTYQGQPVDLGELRFRLVKEETA